jgi:1-acyl-sn-glycerol-3-phosphate acyltransferase
MSSFKLLKKRKFAPFFGVQFLGAFNDNLFKNALIILVAHTLANETNSGFYINLAAGLFILPFVLFSPLAGQIGDQTEKASLIKKIKLAEIPIMILGVAGFYMGSISTLLLALSLMGIQSAFFGPVKYSILPQTLERDELMDGNGLVEMSTFLAILFGTMVGGFLIIQSKMAVSITMIGTAAVGYVLSLFIPKSMPTCEPKPLKLNVITETVELIRIAKEKDSVFKSIIGISWYWFVGALILAQIPNYTIHTLKADESVVTLLLAVVSISIGLGSIACAKLSRGEIEIGMVPLGALGISIPMIDFYFINHAVEVGANASLLNIKEFLSPSAISNHRVVLDLFLFGFFGSFFIVPLYAFIQHRGKREYRSRIIAANNVMNAVFMVGSALLAMLLLGLGFTISEMFLFVGVMNFFVAIYIFSLIPEFMLRFCMWILASTIYKIKYKGRKNIPSDGAGLIIANHVSFVDWFILTATARRPIVFIMDHNIFKLPVVGFLFKLAKAIPIAPASEDPDAKKKAFIKVGECLEEGSLVCIFPEGKLTGDGKMDTFKPGMLKILEKNPVPVIPIGLNGLWESIFAKNKDKQTIISKLLSFKRDLIKVEVGEVLSAYEGIETYESKVRKLVD